MHIHIGQSAMRNRPKSIYNHTLTPHRGPSQGIFLPCVFFYGKNRRELRITRKKHPAQPFHTVHCVCFFLFFFFLFATHRIHNTWRYVSSSPYMQSGRNFVRVCVVLIGVRCVRAAVNLFIVHCAFHGPESDVFRCAYVLYLHLNRHNQMPKRIGCTMFSVCLYALYVFCRSSTFFFFSFISLFPPSFFIWFVCFWCSFVRPLL